MTEETAAVAETSEEELVCPGCDSRLAKNGEPWKSLQAVDMHFLQWCPGNPAATGNKRKRPLDAVGKVRSQSRRGQRQRSSEGVPSTMDQIPRGRNQTAPILNGSAAYYFRRDGATIAEGLTRYPNGAGTGKQGRNAALYRQRQEARGNVFLGQNLTKQAVEKMMAIILSNRNDYILFLKEEIEQTNADLDSTFITPETRDKQRRRRGQLEHALAVAEQPIDVDKLVGELEEIGQAQRLARTFSGGQLQALREMIGDVVQSHEASLAARMAASLPERGPDSSEESDSHIDLTESGEQF